ncbi:MAG TPA: hypothetical protein VHH11_10625 [Gammaproteobacteria bacterium]|nr:hypothetical protein [Gammaproteobacteria bacterium]
MADNPRSADFRAPLAAFGVAALAALAGLAMVAAGTAPAVKARPHAAAQAHGNAPVAATAVDDLPGFAPQAPPVEEGPLRYDVEYPTIPYSKGARTDAVAALIARLERGDVKLEYRPPRGYLDSLLAALKIDPSSQVLVYSQTSLQSRVIGPATPRAIYFNDDVYVAWVQFGGPIEIASQDPSLGPVFYLLEQTEGTRPKFTGELTKCLSCHDSYSLSGGGVPRYLVGSGYTGITGMLVSHEGWILVTDRTPLKSRWGGWYVTGRHGDQVHLGNMRIRSLHDFDDFEAHRVGNLDTLDGLFNTQPYLTDRSDIVALLVFQHQLNVQNQITRLSYDARTALAAAAAGRIDAREAERRMAEPVEELLKRMLFVDAAEYTAPISGDPGFATQFASRAVRDGQGRSLRDFDLTHRLFRYPFSYVVYSAAFDALPAEAKSLFYRRLDAILQGKDHGEGFAALAADDRAAILEILRATKPDFVRAVAN